MNVNSISLGNVIRYKDRYWIITKKEHVKPGKGGAFIQAEMKDIVSGTKLNERFRAGEDVEKIAIEEVKFQYQYDEGDTIALMNLETYDQESFGKNLLGDRVAFLTDGMEVRICYCGNVIVEAKLPDTVVCTIKETEPTVKGQTATASFKPAILENGIRIMVPQFITGDDKVIVKTDDCSYVERAK
ncbi:MAG: elongation factor P [Rickettsiales bacterium]|jgi:elongation factor P|nr:elongation factor P [Rickettsiales bacterium]